MLMKRRVEAAFLPTFAAAEPAQDYSLPKQFYVRFLSAGKHPPGPLADVGAIEIEANAAKQLSSAGFCQTGVRARHAGLSTSEASFDASS